jgi:hypothetical protein
VICDLDVTLGQGDTEISASLQRLFEVAGSCDVCLVTGRRVSEIPMVVRRGTLLSPWGGGHILCARERGWKYVGAPVALTVGVPERESGWLGISGRFDDAGYLVSERVVAAMAADGGASEVLLSSFRRWAGISTHARDVPACAVRGSDGSFWEHRTPWPHPRRALVEALRAMGYTRILYAGDSAEDTACADLVSLFLWRADFAEDTRGAQPSDKVIAPLVQVRTSEDLIRKVSRWLC